MDTDLDPFGADDGAVADVGEPDYGTVAELVPEYYEQGGTTTDLFFPDEAEPVDEGEPQPEPWSLDQESWQELEGAVDWLAQQQTQRVEADEYAEWERQVGEWALQVGEEGVNYWVDQLQAQQDEHAYAQQLHEEQVRNVDAVVRDEIVQHLKANGVESRNADFVLELAEAAGFPYFMQFTDDPQQAALAAYADALNYTIETSAETIEAATTRDLVSRMASTLGMEIDDVAEVEQAAAARAEVLAPVYGDDAAAYAVYDVIGGPQASVHQRAGIVQSVLAASGHKPLVVPDARPANYYADGGSVTGRFFNQKGGL